MITRCYQGKLHGLIRTATRVAKPAILLLLIDEGADIFCLMCKNILELVANTYSYINHELFQIVKFWAGEIFAPKKGQASLSCQEHPRNKNKGLTKTWLVSFSM